LYAGWPAVDGAVPASFNHWSTQWHPDDSMYQRHVTTEEDASAFIIKSKFQDGDPESTVGFMPLKVLWPDRFLTNFAFIGPLWRRVYRAVAVDVLFNVTYQVELKMNEQFQDNFLGATQFVLGMVNGRTVDFLSLDSVGAAFAAGMPAHLATNPVQASNPTTRVYRTYKNGACFYNTCTPEACGGCVIRENSNQSYIAFDSVTQWTQPMNVTVHFDSDASSVAIGMTMANGREVLPLSEYEVPGMAEEREDAKGSFGLGLGMMYGQMRVSNFRISSDRVLDTFAPTPAPPGPTPMLATYPTTRLFVEATTTPSPEDAGTTPSQAAASQNTTAANRERGNGNVTSVADGGEEENATTMTFMIVITVISVLFSFIMFAAAVRVVKGREHTHSDDGDGTDHVYSAISSDSFQMEPIESKARAVYSAVAVLEPWDESECSEVLYTAPPKPGDANAPDMPAYHLTSLVERGEDK